MLFEDYILVYLEDTASQHFRVKCGITDTDNLRSQSFDSYGPLLSSFGKVRRMLYFLVHIFMEHARFLKKKEAEENSLIFKVFPVSCLLHHRLDSWELYATLIMCRSTEWVSMTYSG